MLLFPSETKPSSMIWRNDFRCGLDFVCSFSRSDQIESDSSKVDSSMCVCVGDDAAREPTSRLMSLSIHQTSVVYQMAIIWVFFLLSNAAFTCCSCLCPKLFHQALFATVAHQFLIAHFRHLNTNHLRRRNETNKDGVIERHSTDD